MSQTRVTCADLAATSRVGLPTDIAAGAYLTALPFLAVWICSYIPGCRPAAPLMAVDACVALAMSIICVSDLIVYGYWSFRLDVTAFTYAGGAFASVSAVFAVLAVSVILLVAAAIFGLFYLAALATGAYNAVDAPAGILPLVLHTLAYILGGGALFACIRGLKHRPNSPYQLYYSTNMYLNHAAVNPVFNMVYSTTVKDKERDRFDDFDPDECKREMQAALPLAGEPRLRLLNNKRPNILLIIWESLAATFVERLGGKPDVLPNFERLCDEGVLFTRVDAGSWRTDKGLVCILSGYPAPPTTSIMRNTHLLQGLPALPKTLEPFGYKAHVVHGGDLSIMHQIDYYLMAGHKRVTAVGDIDKSAARCAWGVHDGPMFDWLYNDIASRNKADEPWFITFQTLSSHQPFEVPYKRLDDEIDNSYAYTDDAFGRFIDRLKQLPVWRDTLVIVLGDHGMNVNFRPTPRSIQPHIPILLLGGAVKAPMQINTMMSQCDLAATLLAQLDIDHKEYIFSRDVLADTYTDPFTINIYNNGFLLRDPRGYTEFDNVSRRAVDSPDALRERRGRMFLQYLMQNLSR